MKYDSISFWGIYAVWRRNSLVYQKTWLFNSLPPLSEPIIYLIAFGYGLTPLVGEVSYLGKEVNYLQFLAPGIIAIAILFQSFFEAAYGSFVRLKYQKTWQALLTAPLTFTEIFLGDLFWAATKGLLAAILTSLVAIIWGILTWWQFLLSFPVIILGCLLFASIGLLSAGIARTIDQLNIPIFLFLIPMFTLCGTYFPRNVLPSFLQNIATVLPLSFLVDLLRWHLGISNNWFLSIIFLFLWTITCVVIAWKTTYPKLLQ